MKYNYLALIINVFEKLQPIALSTIQSKRKYFQEKILEKQKEQSGLITKKEFLDNCEIAVDQLKEHVRNGINLLIDKKINPLILEMNFGIRDVSTFKLGTTNIDRKKELDSMIKNINEQYGKETNININYLVKNTKMEMSLTDVEFIESVFENINYIENGNESEIYDLSNTSVVQKIIYLNELGIIDFLKRKPEFIASTNLMATILSSITGEKASTLQPSLNRLISNDIEDKNHPYNTKSTVNKVLQTLNSKNIKPKTS
ncbi:hypothetical protein EV144_101258 [Flavobacterium sp. 270]|uniref:hypothetical protein n=1 Tax=Flavobacterium sp. 270 TaxID=2512114 RepID=UPI0010654F55|nr:hypothetical protein [Flavobacterium sp. 270]TDW51582.1 hypothetical protein EV144_101258 [Flavobacterium sp. 270]